MSAVIPKDLTGLVRDPTKCDAWIEAERHPQLNNLCEEITLPMTPYVTTNDVIADFCKLGVQDSLTNFINLANYHHMTQVHSKVRFLMNDPNIVITTLYSGALQHQLLPALDAEELAVRLISEHEEDLTQLDNVLGTLTSAHRQEWIKLLSSVAATKNLKDQQLMQATNLNIPVGGFKRGELTAINASTDSESSKLGELLEGTKSYVRKPELKALDQGRKSKRKKSKPKSKHLPNMNNSRVKRALGATILMKLGQVQRDTMDTYKRAMLKELPAADLIEMATGDKLPDYQANLINSMQVKADPSAPVVTRMQDGITKDPVSVGTHSRTYVGETVDDDLGRGLINPELYISCDEFGNPI